MRKLTTEQFINKAEEVHGKYYSYSKTEYVNTRAKIVITCPIHGDFEQEANSHLQGSGCKLCVVANKLNKSSNNVQAFLCKANNKHNGKYTYDKSVYIDSKTKLTITCPLHGDFEQRPNDHLCGKGCPKCGCKLTTEEFIAKAISVHGYRYNYSNSNYTANKSKVIITCYAHGDFEQTPNSHLAGKGCPNCASSGFDKSKPAILYYLKINGGQAYKIGITNRTINERFTNSELQLIEVINTWYYKDGAECYAVEQKILDEYKEYKYIGPNILESGNTELFNTDIINFLSFNSC